MYQKTENFFLDYQLENPVYVDPSVTHFTAWIIE